MEKEKERKRKERREGRGGRREERCINDLTPLNISHSILSILRASNKNNTPTLSVMHWFIMLLSDWVVLTIFTNDNFQPGTIPEC